MSDLANNSLYNMSEANTIERAQRVSPGKRSASPKEEQISEAILAMIEEPATAKPGPCWGGLEGMQCPSNYQI